MKLRLLTVLFTLLCIYTNKALAQEEVNKCEEKKDIQFPYDNFFFQRAYPEFGNILPAFEKAQSEARQMMNNASRSNNFDIPWTIEGPYNLGGRVNTVAINPTNSNIMYAGTAQGGIYKTTNGGTTWVSVVDTLSYFAVGDIKIDPNNHNIIYAGLGDPNISGYPAIGNGLLKSTDAGATWHNIGLSDTRIIAKVEIHPLNSNIIYAATMGLPFEKNNARGLYKSNDGGQTWAQKLFINDSTGIIDLVLDKTDTNILYAVSWSRIRQNLYSVIANADSKIWKSTDGGNNWTQLTNGLPTGAFSRISISRSEQNHNTLYALYVDSASLEMFGVYKTTDGGANWVMTSIAPVPALGGFGWYFGNLTVNPYNDNNVFLPGVDLWGSTDGGATFQMYTPEWFTYEVHADKHCIKFVNANTIVLCTDGGIYKTTNMGAVWTDIDNIPITQFYRVAVRPGAAGVYSGGAQDNGTSFGNAAAPSQWPRAYGGDGFQQRFNPANNNIWYTEIQNGGIVYTTDDGQDFNDATQGINELDRRNWDMPYIISNFNNTTFYTGTYKIYKSEGAVAPNWFEISTSLTDEPEFEPRFHTISAIEESPLSKELLYAGTSDGNVWRTDDGGFNWLPINTGLPDRYVTGVKAGRVNSDMVFVSHSGYKDNDNIPHLHVSFNRGNTWTNISGNLPSFAVNDIELSTLNDSLIFISTDGGVYYTTDMGGSWERLGNNMPLLVVYDIELDEQNQKLIAGTFARSIWSIEVDSILNLFALNLQLTANDTICAGESVSLFASGANTYTWSPTAGLNCAACATVAVTPAATTTYTVTGNNGTASANASVTITVVPLPATPNISYTQGVLTGPAAAGYQWYVNNQPIPGATDSIYVPATNGDYYLTVYNELGCERSSSVISIVNVGVDEDVIKNTVTIYPNPANSFLQVDNKGGAEVEVTLQNIEGQIAARYLLTGPQNRIDITTLAKGIYIARCNTQGISSTRKIIKL